MINKQSSKISLNYQVLCQFHCELADRNSIQKEQVRFSNVKEFIDIEKKKMNETIFFKKGFCQKSKTKSFEDLKQIKEIWKEQKIMSLKQNSEIIKKPRSIETIILVCSILILYFFALVLAPNQFCCSKE